MVKKIESWKTFDGNLFETEIAAVKHESYLLGKISGHNDAVTTLASWAEEAGGGSGDASLRAMTENLSIALEKQRKEAAK